MEEQQHVAIEQDLQNSSDPSTDSFRLAEQIAKLEIENNKDNPTLKQTYIHLMNQLQIDGTPKEKISTIGSKIILDKKKK